MLTCDWLKGFRGLSGRRAVRSTLRRSPVRARLQQVPGVAQVLETRCVPTTIDLAALGVQGTTLFGAEASDRSGMSVSDAGELKINRRAADVADIARDCVDDYRASSDAAGLTVVFEVIALGEHTSTLVTTDPVRVRQVLGNVLSNAVKYTPRGGVVQISVAARTDAELGQVITCDVADTGPGIPEPLRERVFEEFFRVPATVAIAQGTGVGLAIARRVARLLGGDLRVRETSGGGATFSLLIPSE